MPTTKNGKYYVVVTKDMSLVCTRKEMLTRLSPCEGFEVFWWCRGNPDTCARDQDQFVPSRT